MLWHLQRLWLMRCSSRPLIGGSMVRSWAFWKQTCVVKVCWVVVRRRTRKALINTVYHLLTYNRIWGEINKAWMSRNKLATQTHKTQQQRNYQLLLKNCRDINVYLILFKVFELIIVLETSWCALLCFCLIWKPSIYTVCICVISMCVAVAWLRRTY